ncbi:MAG: hypothetical protein GEV09_19770 [Pseudonocardiaceae bacterium]|nr:hypothetical protein [Pseudonocardiaceae bacterium]
MIRSTCFSTVRGDHLDIYDVISDAEPLDDPVAFRFPANARRRYEPLSRWPVGLLVMGDAVGSFNPVYGQGITVAALEALTLRRHLQRGSELRPRRFLRDIARLVDVPWNMAVGADLAFPGVAGRRRRAGSRPRRDFHPGHGHGGSPGAAAASRRRIAGAAADIPGPQAVPIASTVGRPGNHRRPGIVTLQRSLEVQPTHEVIEPLIAAK